MNRASLVAALLVATLVPSMAHARSVTWTSGVRDIRSYSSGRNVEGPPSVDEESWSNTQNTLLPASVDSFGNGNVSRASGTAFQVSGWIGGQIYARGETTVWGDSYGFTSDAFSQGHAKFNHVFNVQGSAEFNIRAHVRTFITKAPGAQQWWLNLAAEFHLINIDTSATVLSLVADQHGENLSINQNVYLPAGNYRIMASAMSDLQTSRDELGGGSYFEIIADPIPAPASLLPMLIGGSMASRRRR
jgi:hypothetical protein